MLSSVLDLTWPGFFLSEVTQTSLIEILAKVCMSGHSRVGHHLLIGEKLNHTTNEKK